MASDPHQPASGPASLGEPTPVAASLGASALWSQEDTSRFWSPYAAYASTTSSLHALRHHARPAMELLPRRKAFFLFAAANTAAALFSPIQDCDEVFNFWEPTHYLNHGFGLQTWENSPEYAIRSWAYAGLHASVIQIGRLLPFMTKVGEFYFLRIVLALFCAFSIFFLMALVSSPGMYHAAAAYLPSSFAMCTAMLGFAAFMDGHGRSGTPSAIFWFACGALLGWPFSGALIFPFILEQVWMALSSGLLFPAFKRLVNGGLRALLLLALQTGVDSLFYRKLVCVPLNIVLYNVFNSGDKGPNIYGVEPWHYYLRNLALNFNLWLILALGAAPLLLLQNCFGQKAIFKQRTYRPLVFLTPFYLWLTIFTLQPHKEERFMYPAYPALALNAAISLHILLVNLGSTDPHGLIGKIPSQLKLLVAVAFITGALNLGALRAIGLMTAYSAPLSIYAPLQQHSIPVPDNTLETNVCLGKEWYRFPSSYFLPNNMRAKFIRSEFRGLLPAQFSEAGGYFPGTWMIPEGMNDENREEPSHYTSLDSCNFLVDSRFPSASPTVDEPDFMANTEDWDTLYCTSFLDAGSTGFLGRMLWVPDLPFVPEKFRRKWGEYCLLRNKNPLTEEEYDEKRRKPTWY